MFLALTRLSALLRLSPQSKQPDVCPGRDLVCRNVAREGQLDFDVGGVVVQVKRFSDWLGVAALFLRIVYFADSSSTTLPPGRVMVGVLVVVLIDKSMHRVVLERHVRPFLCAYFFGNVIQAQ